MQSGIRLRDLVVKKPTKRNLQLDFARLCTDDAT